MTDKEIEALVAAEGRFIYFSIAVILVLMLVAGKCDALKADRRLDRIEQHLGIYSEQAEQK